MKQAESEIELTLLIAEEKCLFEMVRERVRVMLSAEKSVAR